MKTKAIKFILEGKMNRKHETKDGSVSTKEIN